MSWADAAAYVKALLLSLEPPDFGWADTIANNRVDVYGKKDAVTVWYVKWRIGEDGALEVQACHESTEEQMKLLCGVVLRKERQDEF
jgi:hypothetical protein